MSQPKYPVSLFTTGDLVRAIAPIREVLESFQRENEDWSSVESQGRFARLVESHQKDFGPYQYLKSLVRLYVSRVEAKGHEIEDDSLLSLILHFSMTKDCALPNPLESCYISFCIPSAECTRYSNNFLRLRVFPRHNNVALKLWEAGACLAEYLLQSPHHVAGKDCAELGSGIGLTGLVLAGYCQPLSFHMTDYTEAGLQNLQHNVKLNQEWLRQRVDERSRVEGMITQGYLDWEEYAAESNMSTLDVEPASAQASSNNALSNAQVLLAADVAYDITNVPFLAQTVYRFLTSGGSDKVAIVATTLRSKKTFTAFEQHLGDNGIECDYVDNKILESTPYVFPVYNVQQRSDVRICFMKLARQGEQS